MAGTHRGHYDAVVIGSGFGGAVAATTRPPASDLKVLLLERGCRIPRARSPAPRAR